MPYTDIKHVSSLAGGGGDGSIGNEWTLTEGYANIAARRLIKIYNDGTYVVGTNITTSVSGTAPGFTTGGCVFVGVDATTKAPVTTKSARPVIDAATLVGGTIITLSISFLNHYGLAFINGPSAAFSGLADQYSFVFCRFEDNDQGLALDDFVVVRYSEFLNNTSEGISQDNNLSVSSSIFAGSGVGVYGENTVSLRNCLFYDNTIGATLNANSGHVECCTFDSNGTGLKVGSLYALGGFGNIYSNNTIGLNLSGAGDWPISAFGDFYNNTTDISEASTGRVGLVVGGQSVDPDYTSIATYDSEINAAALIDALDEQQMGLTVGAWQGNSGGGGGARIPRTRRHNV